MAGTGLHAEESHRLKENVQIHRVRHLHRNVLGFQESGRSLHEGDQNLHGEPQSRPEGDRSFHEEVQTLHEEAQNLHEGNRSLHEEVRSP